MTLAPEQMKQVESFFLDIMEGRLPNEADQRARGMEFFGVQGPWYTLGYRMWSTVERAMGRSRVIEDTCNPARLLLDYNVSVASDSAAPRWSVHLLSLLSGLMAVK
jgi:hypothetical protein